jgi:WD40 repeat protein
VLRGHEQAPLAVRFTPDGSRLVSAGPEGAVRIWTVDGVAEEVFTGHGGNVSEIAVSPDGARIASVGIDGTARLWTRGAPGGRIVVEGRDAVARLVGFTGDGRDLVLLARDAFLVCPVDGDGCARLTPAAARPTRGTVRTVIEASGREVTVEDITTWADDVFFAAFLPGQRAFVSCDGARVTVWDVDRGERWSQALAVRACAVSPDGGRLAVSHGGDVAGVSLLPTATGQPRGLLEADGGGLVFSPDGRRLALAAYPGVVVWDLEAAARERSLPIAGDVEAMAFSPDGARVAVETDGAVVVHTLAADAPRTIDGAGAFAVSPDGALLATAYRDGSLRLWDLAPELALRPLVETEVAGLSASVDGARLGVLTPSGPLQVVSIADGATLFEAPLGTDCGEASLAPDGGWVAGECRDEVRLFDVATGAARSVAAQGATWLAGHQLLAWRWAEPALLLVDAAGGDPRTIELPGAASPGGATEILSVHASRDGAVASVVVPDKLLLVALGPGTATEQAGAPCTAASPVALAWDGVRFACAVGREIWLADAAGGARWLRGHAAEVLGLAFLADGRLVSTARDGMLRIWEPSSGEARAIVVPVADAVPVAGADGTTVLTVAAGGSQIWDLEAGAWWAPPLVAEQLVPLGERSFVVRSGPQLLVLTDDAPEAARLAGWIEELTEATIE